MDQTGRANFVPLALNFLCNNQPLIYTHALPTRAEKVLKASHEAIFRKEGTLSKSTK